MAQFGLHTGGDNISKPVLAVAGRVQVGQRSPAAAMGAELSAQIRPIVAELPEAGRLKDDLAELRKWKADLEDKRNRGIIRPEDARELDEQFNARIAAAERN